MNTSETKISVIAKDFFFFFFLFLSSCSFKRLKVVGIRHQACESNHDTPKFYADCFSVQNKSAEKSYLGKDLDTGEKKIWERR